MNERVEGYRTDLTTLQVSTAPPPWLWWCNAHMMPARFWLHVSRSDTCSISFQLSADAQLHLVVARPTPPHARMALLSFCSMEQATLTSEMGGLRSELADVKARIRAQLEANGEAIANLHARGDPGTRAELEGAAVAAVAAAGKARA